MHSIKKYYKYVKSVLCGRLIHLNMQILYKCNFKCRICDFWKPPYNEFPLLSLEQVKIINRKISRIGPQIVSLGGGEPLLHPQLIEITQELSGHHFPVMICNGWFMTPAIAKRLMEAGMYEVSISVDYANPEKHDKQRGMPGAFDRAIKALQMLNENRIHPMQRVHMISVIMEDNIEEVEELIKLAKDIGITYLVTLYSDHRGSTDKYETSCEISKHLLALKKKYPEFVALPGYIKEFSRYVANDSKVPKCTAGKRLFNIDSQGNVSTCIDRLDLKAGNLLEDSMESVVAELHKIQSGNNCRTCWTSCRGTIETMLYGGDKPANFLALRSMTKNKPLVNPKYA